MIHVAPAARAVSVLHLAETCAPLPDPGAEDRTRCGLPMIAGELWIPVDKRPGDRLCPACSETVDTQLALWS